MKTQEFKNEKADFYIIMDTCDVFIVGGGIAGSVMAKFTAKNGLNTILIEKDKTPREKPCSGIQFGYFEDIIGEEIPPERLCNVQLKKVKMFLPSGKKVWSPFGMLNFMRDVFDDWLNEVAQRYGTKFIDQCKYLRYSKKNGLYKIEVEKMENSGKKEIYHFTSKYLIDASGLRPVIRKQIRPQDFENKCTGVTLNYYIRPENDPDLDPNMLYQFWDVDFNDIMFAWTYMKTLDDGNNYWVVGTGCLEGDIKERQKKFYQYIQEKFDLNGIIVKKEAFASNINMEADNRIWLGKENILMVGDAAGLVDPVRGVGMDAAALSGRLAAKAIVQAEKENKRQPKERGDTLGKALEFYKEKANRITEQTRKNQERGISQFESNEELESYMKKSMAKMGIKLIVQAVLNKFRKPENFVLLPP